MKLTKLLLSFAVGALVLNGAALADTPEQIKFDRAASDARFQMRIWENDIENAFGAEASRTHAELLNSMKTASDKLLAYLKEKPCKDNAQAQELEKYLHSMFHQLYGRIVADIKHGVNLSCRDHKLVPTLWVTDYLPKSSKTTYAAASGAKPETPEHARAEVTRVVKEWASKVSGVLPYKGPTAGEAAAKTTLRSASTTAAQALSRISCAGDDKLAGFAIQALADGVQMSVPQMTNVFPVTCTGGKLHGTMTL